MHVCSNQKVVYYLCWMQSLYCFSFLTSVHFTSAELLRALHPRQQGPGDKSLQDRGWRTSCGGQPHLLSYLCPHSWGEGWMDEQHQVSAHPSLIKGSILIIDEIYLSLKRQAHCRPGLPFHCSLSCFRSHHTWYCCLMPLLLSALKTVFNVQ